MNTGEEFVKKIRPLGAALFLIVFALFLIIAFTSGRDPLPDYSPPQSADYYAQNEEALAELQAELETNLIPALGGGLAEAEIEEGRLRLTLEKGRYAKLRSAILHYYEARLFIFAEAGQ